MKKIILFTFLFFISFAAFAQSSQNVSESSSFRLDKQEIKVFPNPATQYFKLTDKSESVAMINIYNIVGKKMETFNVAEGSEYRLDRFPKGIYLVQLIDINNKIVATQRLNIKKP